MQQTYAENAGSAENASRNAENAFLKKNKDVLNRGECGADGPQIKFLGAGRPGNVIEKHTRGESPRCAQVRSLRDPPKRESVTPPPPPKIRELEKSPSASGECQGVEEALSTE